MHDRKSNNRARASRCLGTALLLAAAIAPGAAMAVDGKIGTSQYYSRLAADVNGKKYRIAELPLSWYAGRPNCAVAAGNGTLKSTPYVVSFVGGTGNFGNTDPGNAVRNDYYQKKMMDTAASLSVNGNCIRVLSVETAFAAEGGYDNYISYFNDGFFGATMSGSSQVYWPMSKGASAEFATTLAIQRDLNYSTAARWYLHGGSASAMHSARLLDMLNDGAVAAYAYKIPEATILESLPISGDMLAVCGNVNALSSADRIISSIYAGYETANTCSVVRGNPSLYNYKVYGVGIRDWYVGAKGKSVYVMMGANDPLWKETLDKTDPASGGSIYYVSPTITGWAALGVYRNFLATIGVAESSCTNRSANVFDASHASYMYNAYQKADCGAGGRIRIRQYQHGGHGPIYNFAAGAIPAGERNAMDQMRVWLF